MSCKCQECEKQYQVDVIVPNDIWEQIKPTGKAFGAGLLCGRCIFNRIAQLDTEKEYGFVKSVPCGLKKFDDGACNSLIKGDS